MSRRKPRNLFPVKDLAAANAALGEMGQLQRSIEAVQHRMNQTIDQAKAEAEAEAAPLQSRLEALENGLQAFAEYNKDELFKGRKTVKLDFGLLGYRKSTKLATLAKITWAMVLEKLLELGFAEAIRTKEEVNREVVKGWPEERQALVGCRTVEEDEFWVEADQTKLCGQEKASEAA